jgi:hypothetical protein
MRLEQRSCLLPVKQLFNLGELRVIALAWFIQYKTPKNLALNVKNGYY